MQWKHENETYATKLNQKNEVEMYLHELSCCFKWSIYHVCHVLYTVYTGLGAEKSITLRVLSTESPDNWQSDESTSKNKKNFLVLKKRESEAL